MCLRRMACLRERIDERRHGGGLGAVGGNERLVLNGMILDSV